MLICRRLLSELCKIIHTARKKILYQISIAVYNFVNCFYCNTPLFRLNRDKMS